MNNRKKHKLSVHFRQFGLKYISPNRWKLGLILGIFFLLIFFAIVWIEHKEHNEFVDSENRKFQKISLDINSFDSLVTAEYPQWVDSANPITTGIFLTNIYDINTLDNSFKATFWVWLTYDSSFAYFSEVSMENIIDVFDARDVVMRMYSSIKPELERKKFWSWALFDATFVKDWNVINYPFDKHDIKIEIEIAYEDIRRLKLVKDSTSGYEKRITYSDWEQLSFDTLARINHYESNFGDPYLHMKNKRDSYYSSLLAELTLKRKNSFYLYIKVFAGLFSGYLICVLGLLVSIESVARFSLHIVGVITAITNKLNVDKIIPQHSGLTLSDYTHFIGFTGMMGVILVSAIRLTLIRIRKEADTGIKAKSHRSTDIRLFAFFTLFAIIANIFLLLFMRTAEFNEICR